MIRSKELQSGEMVLYHPHENRIILTKKQSHKCEFCGTQLTQKISFDEQYFNIIQDTTFNDQFNQGYYDRFFVELEKLGRGQRGSVFLCSHRLDEVDLGIFAVKAIPVGDSHQWLVRMLKEVTLLGRLKHPNIIEYKHAWLENRQLHTFGPEVPCLFILMELANGGNLEEYINLTNTDSKAFDLNPVLDKEDRLKKKRQRAQYINGMKVWPQTLHKEYDLERIKQKGGILIENGIKKRYLTPIEIKSFFLDICNGLLHLHDHKIIHRDLKPPNLLMKYEIDKVGLPRVLISDFGECQLFSEEVERQRTGATGTLEFMPPELLVQDEKGAYIPNHDPMADMWSLGVVLYFLCYSKVPYTQTDDVALLKKEILEFKVEDLVFSASERVDLRYNEIICELLDYDAGNRPVIKDVIKKVMELDIGEKEFGVSPVVECGHPRRVSIQSNIETLEEVNQMRPIEVVEDIAEKVYLLPKEPAVKNVFDPVEVLKMVLFVLPVVPSFICSIPRTETMVVFIVSSMGMYLSISFRKWHLMQTISGMVLVFLTLGVYSGSICK
jgi:serine/threonine protein kinase